MAHTPNDPRTAIYRYVANADGDKQMKGVDYGTASASATGVFFYCASTSVELHRCIVFIEDTKGMEPEEYGNLGAALSTGYALEVWNSAGGSSFLDLCDGLPIKTNAEIGAMSYDVDLFKWTNTTNEVAVARLTFAKSGRPLLLAPKMQFRTTQVDNLTGLIDHRIQLQGIQVKGL